MHRQLIYHDDQHDLQSHENIIPFNLNHFQDNQLNVDRMHDLFDPESISYQNQLHHKPFNTTLPGYLFEDDFRLHHQFCQQQDQEQVRRSQSSNKNQTSQKLQSDKRKFQQLKTKLEVRQRWHKCKVGDRFQTKNLCKYLFTETANYLKMMASANELSQSEKEQVSSFLQKKNKISLAIFNDLFLSKQLRQKCLEFYESNQFVSGIFKSRADIKTKLNIVKYLQRIRRIPISKQTIRWKN